MSILAKTIPPKTKARPSLAAQLSGMEEPAIREKMLQDLQGSGLSPKDAIKMRLEPATKGSARKRGLPAIFESYIIPYFDLDGNPTRFYRAKYVVDTRKGFDKMAGRKALRYGQVPDTISEAYLPPFVDWRAIAADPLVPIIITEGEKKAACATKHKYPTIGLGGVWSFMSKRFNIALLPIFGEFELGGRSVYICFDSDAATNPDVTAAERKLCQRLTEAGAVVHVARLTVGEDGKKMGLDDFICAMGENYAVALDKVLEKATPYAGSEMLHELNERVVYVRNPGVIWDHRLRVRMSPSNFMTHSYSDWNYWEEVMVNPKLGTTRLVERNAPQMWIKWPHRASVDGIDYRPGQDYITEEGYLNTWTGWGLPNGPCEGDVSPWHDLMSHLFGNDTAARRYFEQWCAYPLQHPGAKMAVAAVIWGTVHGSGKTLVGHTLMRIYGANAMELHDSDLEDDRNEWAEAKQFVLADDLTSRGDRKFMRRLMTMITQKFIRLNPKYIPSYSQRDLINYYFTSNDPDAMFMDDQDRRFFVHEVLAGKYIPFKDYVKWRDSDSGAAALWAYLLALDLTGFDPQASAPMTVGKELMIEVGKSDLGAWVFQLRQNTDHLLAKAKFSGDLFSPEQLYMLYCGGEDKKASPNALSRELKRAGFPLVGGASEKIKTADGRTIRAYAVRNIEYWKKASWSEACDHYAKHHPDLNPASKKPAGASGGAPKF